MILDHRTEFFNSTRSALSNINTPLNWVLTTPVRLHEFVDEFWPNEKLRARVNQLEIENQHLQIKAQKYQALEVEKKRLLVLLSASRLREGHSVQLGRIIRTAMQDAYDQRIVIDRGRRDAVQISQPVVDANGLIGQISKISRDHAVVTVITDINHAVPVEVLRNGLNTVARGSGGRRLLSLPFLSFQADIEVGDTLVSSGLGGVFPAGHPVAEIVDIKGVPGEQFLKVYARPFAELDKIKNVLLLERRILQDFSQIDSDDDQSQTEQTAIEASDAGDAQSDLGDDPETADGDANDSNEASSQTRADLPEDPTEETRASSEKNDSDDPETQSQ